MELKPLKRYSVPSYPTRNWLDEHPELLRLVPQRWRGNKLVLATVGAAAMLLVSCHDGTSDRATTQMLHVDTGPLLGFAPPAPRIMSEADARRIIEDEAARQGLHFEHDVLPIISVVERAERDMAVDGYDRRHNVAYEYVSEREQWDWFRSLPKIVTENSAAPRPMLAVFCAPRPSHNDNVAVYEFVDSRGVEEIRTVSVNPPEPGRRPEIIPTESDLRAQVCEFVLWLKAEGII